MQHGVLARDLVGAHGQVEAGACFADDVEVGHGWLHEQHVGAFRDVLFNFPHGFAEVGTVHLVGATVAELRSGVGGVAEGAVEGGGEFRGVAEDGRVVFAGFVDCCAHGGDAAIHHVAGCDDVSTGFGEGCRGFCEESYAGVVFYFEMIAVAVDEAAMAVRGVFAEADVCDDDERLCFAGGLDCAEASLDDAVGCPGSGALLVFFGGNAEEQNSADSEIGAGFDLLERLIDGEIKDAGHAADLAANTFALADKKRINESAGTQMRLSNERTHGGSGAEPSQASCRKFHASILWPQNVCVRNLDHMHISRLGSVLRVGHGCVLIAALAWCENPQGVDPKRSAQRKVDQCDDSEDDCEDASPGLSREQRPASE